MITSLLKTGAQTMSKTLCGLNILQTIHLSIIAV